MSAPSERHTSKSARARALKECHVDGFAPPTVPPAPRAGFLKITVFFLVVACLVALAVVMRKGLNRRVQLYKLSRGALSADMIEPRFAVFDLVRDYASCKDSLIEMLASKDDVAAEGAARVILAADPFGRDVPDRLFPTFVALVRGISEGQASALYLENGEYRFAMQSIGRFWQDYLLSQRKADAMAAAMGNLSEQRRLQLSSSTPLVSYDGLRNLASTIDSDQIFRSLLGLVSRDPAGGRLKLEEIAQGGGSFDSQNAVSCAHMARLLLDELKKSPTSFRRLLKSDLGLMALQPTGVVKAHRGAVVFCCFLGDQGDVLTLGADSMLVVWETKQGEDEFAFEPSVAHRNENAYSTGAAFPRRAMPLTTIVTGDAGGQVEQWRFEAGDARIERSVELASAPAYISALAGGGDVVFAGMPGKIIPLLPSTGSDDTWMHEQEIATEGLIEGLAFTGVYSSGMDGMLVAVDAGGPTRIWSYYRKLLQSPAVSLASSVQHTSVALNATSQGESRRAAILLGDEEGALSFFSLDSSPSLLGVQAGHAGPITEIIWHESKWLLTLSSDGSAILWRHGQAVANPARISVTPLAKLGGFDFAPRHAAFDMSGERVIVGTDGGELGIFDLSGLE